MFIAKFFSLQPLIGEERSEEHWGNLLLPLHHTYSGHQGSTKVIPKKSFSKQCCGSGSGYVESICFWTSRILIRILLSSSKNTVVRKTLIPTVLWLLYDFLSLKNDVNVPSKSNKHKNFKFIFTSWRSLTKMAGSASQSFKVTFLPAWPVVLSSLSVINFQFRFWTFNRSSNTPLHTKLLGGRLVLNPFFQLAGAD